MIIKKLVVQGKTYQRTLSFTNELNIISGETTSGKSLVLSLIDYCLGKDNLSLKVQPELKEHVDVVFLELEINKEIVTISRGIIKNKTSFLIFYSDFNSINEYIPEKMNKKELQTFLMNKLGVIELKKTKNKPRSNELTTETISFRDLFRYCYINQHDLGTHSFLSYSIPMIKYKNPITFEMIFDLVNHSHNELQTEIVKYQNQILKNENKINNLLGYLEQRDNTDYLQLVSNISEFDDQINKLLVRKENLIENQNKESEFISSNKDFVLLNSEINEIDTIIAEINAKKKEINLGILSNTYLLKEYNSEINDLKATQEVNYKLVIDKHMLTCPLCNSQVENKLHTEAISKSTATNFKRLLKDTENKIKMVKEILSLNNKELEKLEVKLKNRHRKKEILSVALREFSKDIKTPYLPQINSINVSINHLEKDREILIESKRVFNKIDELNKLVEDDKDQFNKLKDELSNLEAKEMKRDKIFEELNRIYKSNMKKLKYLDTEDAFIHKDKYIAYYKNASVYEHESGGLLECMQISYLNSIISSGFSKFHPKLLMLDSISKYFGTNKSEIDFQGQDDDKYEVIKDPEVYLNIFNMLVELSSKAQIIVVENTPPDEMSQFVKYTFIKGKNGFIDLNENEYPTK